MEFEVAMSTQGAVLFPNGAVGWFEMHTICPAKGMAWVL